MVYEFVCNLICFSLLSIITGKYIYNLYTKVRGQKDSSDGGFRAKFTIFNRTIPNTV